MPKILASLFTLGCLAGSLVIATTPADAYVVSKSVSVSHGRYGNGCRTVRTVQRGYAGRRVVVRRICN